jgi:hypothetical protein
MNQRALTMPSRDFLVRQAVLNAAIGFRSHPRRALQDYAQRGKVDRSFCVLVNLEFGIIVERYRRQPSL